MRLKTDKQKADFIVNVRSSGQATTAERVTLFERWTGLGRTSYYAIQNDQPLKRPGARAKLDAALRALVVEPGSRFDQEVKARLYATLEGRSPESADYALAQAEAFARTALRSDTAVERCIVLGMQAQRVFFELLSRHGQLRVATHPTFCFTPEVELRELMSRVMPRLKEIIEEAESPPDGLFPSCTDPVILQRSYRLVRLRIASDAVGWSYKTASSVEARASALKLCWSPALVSDFAWAAAIDPAEIGFLYNPLIHAIHADDAVTAERLAAEVFDRFPQLLTESVSGLTPLVDDQDAWPVLALVAQSGGKELAAFRRQLDAVRAQHPALDAGLDRMLRADVGARTYTQKMTLMANGA